MRGALVLILLAGIVVAGACSAPPSPGAAPPAPGASPAATPATPAVTPAAAAVTETIAELPDYPGAIRVALSQRAETERGFTRKSEASWTSADPYASVFAYYQKTIAERGWTVTKTESKATEAEWQLAKGTSVAKVEIKQGAPVTIKIERSDR